MSPQAEAAPLTAEEIYKNAKKISTPPPGTYTNVPTNPDYNTDAPARSQGPDTPEKADARMREFAQGQVAARGESGGTVPTSSPGPDPAPATPTSANPTAGITYGSRAGMSLNYFKREQRAKESEAAKQRTAAGFGGELLETKALMDRQHEINRYRDIDGMNHEDKLKALQDLKLNPFNLTDWYDGLTNGLYRWSKIAADPKVQKLTQEQKDNAATNYYNGVLVPLYQKGKADAPPLELWKQHAYTDALKWNIDDAYQSHWRRGLYGGFRDVENIGKFGLDMMGGVLKDGMKFMENLGYTASSEGRPLTKEQAAPVEAIKADVKQKGVFEQIASETRNIPLLGSTYKSLEKVSSHDAFWHDINPAETWVQSATSFVVEQAMLLPFYRMTGGFNQAGIAAMGEANLTKALMAKPGGKLVANALMNAAEGTTLGLVTRDEHDKKNAWQDGLGQMILGTVFHIGGVKLKNMSDAAVARKAELELAKKGLRQATQDELEKHLVDSMAGAMSVGGRPLQMSMFREAISLIRSLEGTTKEYSDALRDRHLKDDPARWTHVYQTKAYVEKLLDGRKLSELNPQEHREFVAKLQNLMEQAAKKVPATEPVTMAGGKKAVEDMKRTPGGKKEILERVAKMKQADQAAGLQPKPDEHYMKIAEAELAEKQAKAAKKAAEKTAAEPISDAIDVQDARDKAEFPQLPSALKGSKPRYGFGTKNFELSFKDARDLAAYTLTQAKDNKAHAEFLKWYKEQHPGSDGTSILEHAKRVRDFIKKQAAKGDPAKGPIEVPSQAAKPKIKTEPRTSQGTPPNVTQRTRYSTDKYGQPAVSFNTEHSWIVYAKKAVKAAGEKWDSKGITKWLDEIEPEDFAKDLRQHFMPDQLKDAGLYFEQEHAAKLGKQDPNFLAFMYNYRDQMPREFAQKLSSELEDTNKFEKWLDPKVDVEEQKEYYAKGMWNHMADFLHSPSFLEKGELNIYHTTLKNMKTPTVWQHKLHTEMIAQETKIITEMFKGKPAELDSALAAYNALARERGAAFKMGAQNVRAEKASGIDDILTSTGARDRWAF